MISDNGECSATFTTDAGMTLQKYRTLRNYDTGNGLHVIRCQSVIILMINILFNNSYDYRPNWTPLSPITRFKRGSSYLGRTFESFLKTTIVA